MFSSLTFNMAHPVTPMFITKLGLPTFMFGLFFAAMSIGNFIGSPLFGALSDKKGRIRFLILGAIGYGISQLGFGFNTNTFISLHDYCFTNSYSTYNNNYIINENNDRKRLYKFDKDSKDYYNLANHVNVLYPLYK